MTPKKRGNPNLKKGVSGNPGGRPKKTKEQFEFEKSCKEALPIAAGVLKDSMLNGSPMIKLKAAIYVIDRVEGKAPETVNMKAEVTEKKELVGEELLEELKNRGLPENIFEE